MRIRSRTGSGFKLAKEPFHHLVHGGILTCGEDVLNLEQSRKLTKQTSFKLESTVGGNSGLYSEASYQSRDECSGDRFRGNVHKRDGFRPSGE